MEQKTNKAAKRNKIIYWVATIWLALSMLSSGTVQLLQIESEVKFILDLGYPSYFLVFLGITKFLGVLVILLSGFQLMKEWAYAGFFFCMTGALFSHLAVGNPASEIFPPILVLALIIISWALRPANRRIMPTV